MYDYDLIVIGSGPAGFTCSMQSSKFGKRVLVVEANKKHLGGTWINTGTLPNKSLREAAKTIYRYQTQFAQNHSMQPLDRFRMEDLLQYKKTVLESKNRKVQEDFIKNHVGTVRGVGKLLDEHTVEVTDENGETESYSAEFIMVSTGSRPSKPNLELKEGAEILDYKTILDLAHIPKRLVIIGSSIIAFEYATMFSVLGTRITILNDLNDYIPFLDHEIRELFRRNLKKRNIIVHNEISVQKVEKNNLRTSTEVYYTTATDDRIQVIETEHVLHFGGYEPNTGNLGLETIGIDTDENGFIQVSDTYRTSRKNIYAAGDVIGLPAMTSVSFVQGRLAACNMFGIPSQEVPENIPFGIYTIPEIASIGLTENDAHNMGLDITVGRASYSEITQADISNLSEGMLKLVFSTDDLKLLGVHIIGENATDIIHTGQSVMALGGNVLYFIHHVINYPSYTEAYRIAAFNGVNQVNKYGEQQKHILENAGNES